MVRAVTLYAYASENNRRATRIPFTLENNNNNKEE